MEKTNRPIPSSFTASIIEGLQPTSNPMISRARVATFYTGANRNHSFFTESVASNIITRVIGTPVVGFFDESKGDFYKHTSPKEAQTYGHIPEEPNFAWQDIKDEDGVVRSYACFDVYLYTGRHPEAKNIVGKKQSMELDPKTITGSWKVVGGQEVFVYDEAMVSGFCVLGDDYTPCFEGASFFAQETPEEQTAWIDYLNAVREGVRDFLQTPPVKETVEQPIEGGTTQMKMNFGFAEGDVRIALSEALNPNFTEEKGWLIDAVVLTANDDSCLSYNFAKQVYETRKYEIGEEGVSFAEDIAEVKFFSYESEEDHQAHVDALAAMTEVNGKLTEAQTAIETLTTERDNFEAQVSEVKAKVTELESSLTVYQQKDKEIESAKKDELIAEYATLLPEDTIQAISADAANFSYEEIESKLSVEYTRSLRKDSKKVPSGNFDKHSNPERALMDLLSKYSK